MLPTMHVFIFLAIMKSLLSLKVFCLKILYFIIFLLNYTFYFYFCFCFNDIKYIIYYGILAGIFSGFGLGGGLFLVPLFRGLGCQPSQATATTSFTIVITSAINCVQGFLLGVIRLYGFTYFIIVAGAGSYIISVLVSGYLRRIHRLSYVEYLLSFCCS